MVVAVLVTSINAQNPEPETTHLYSLPAENAEDGDQGGQEEKTQAGHQHQHHPVILPSSLMQKCFKFNILYFICLRSRPVDPDVVCPLVSQSVSRIC